MNKFKYYLFFGFIIIIGIVVRLLGIDFGLPIDYCRPDEGFLVSHAVKLAENKLNPQFFHYPNLYIYFLFFLYGIYFVIGLTIGEFTSLQEFKYLYFTNPFSFYLIGRISTAIIGVLTIIMVYKLGKKAYSKEVGLISALLVSLNFLHIKESHFLTTDVPLVFFIIIAYIFIFNIYITGSTKDYILAGVFAGLATSTKYNGIILIIPLIFTHILRNKFEKRQTKKIFFDNRIFLCIIFIIISFLIGTPFAILDYRTFIKDTLFEADSLYKGIYIKPDLPVWIYHFLFSLRYGLGGEILLLISSISLIFIIYRRRASDIIILSFILSYYLLIATGEKCYVRYVLPLIPFLLIIVAEFLHNIISQINMKRYYKIVLLSLSIIIILSQNTYRSIYHSYLLSKKDTRLIAKRWIEKNIKSGTKIAMIGSHYGYPQLVESKESLKEKKEELKESYRIKFLLSLPNYPPSSNNI